MAIHPSVVPLGQILHLNTRLFLNCLDGLTDEAAGRRPVPDANSPVAVALHVVDARCSLASLAGAIFDHPFPAIRAAGSVEKLTTIPTLEVIRSAWNTVSGILARRVSEITEEDLQKPSTVRFPTGDRTVLGTLTFFVQHESSHIGQLAYIRRVLGLPAMSYR